MFGEKSWPSAAAAEALPAPLAPFLDFAARLRGAGFAAAPDQTQGFIAAVGLLGPRWLADLRRAAHALFGPPPERRGEFDALFDAAFLGRALAAPAPGPEEEMPPAFDAAGPELLAEPDEGEEPAGAAASVAERLHGRSFAATDEAGALRAFRRALPARLPRRLGRRFARDPRGARPDARRAFAAMVRRDGEIARLPRLRRRLRQRRVLLLIDISGSMTGATDGALRLAHALVHGAERAEVYTLGTRLTRVTRALAHPAPAAALVRVAGLVADWDGGTRLGDALAVFLALPRLAAHARGALVVVLSDGLERGGPAALVAAMARLRRLAWAILWLTPLRADPGYIPATAALAAILPFLDRLGDGSAPGRVAAEILAFAREVRP
ncbi:MAG: VWA domain-containing protein [Rhodobacteraceae bacterium]|nr:VWA domain-containing protein [Paracoccaceae bacterium]